MKKLLPAAVVLLVLALLALRRAAPRTPADRPGVEDAGMAAASSCAVFGMELRSMDATGFHRWAEEFAAAPAAERAAMLEQGRGLAQEHRARMKLLITSDPRRALEEALPVRLRRELPDEIAETIEQRVNARGFYGVLGSSSAGIRRFFQTADGTQYEARVYGRRVRQRTTENALAHGVALDGVLALDDDPLRLMEAGERPRAGQPVFTDCPVSGKAVAAAAEITPETPAVEMAGEVHYLCTGGHIHALREDAIAAEGGTGGPSKPTGSVPGGWASGVKSVLYIRVTFPDQSTDPQPEKECYDMMKSVNDFMVENSHGALHLLTTVTPLLMMPRPASWYAANDNSSAGIVLSDARATARAAGFDWAAYDLEAVRYSGASGGFSGQAYVGGRGCWLKSGSVGVAVHEFGHNLGLWHANYWSTGGESSIGSGTNSEYGNSFDTMGSANAGNYWFNAGHQNDLGWIPNANVTPVTASGVYRLHQFDQPRVDPAARYLLSVKKDAQRDYWCEFRQKWTSNAWLTSGVQMLWSPWGDSSDDNTAYGSNAGGQLLDATPGSLDGKSDSPILFGRTFSDHGAQIHITPVSKSGTSPESVDVVVNLGDFPGNQPPTLNLSASALTAAVNETLTFSATALDPDGDPVSYSWDWGDRTFGANAAIASKSWSAAGLYTVRCEVSDLRGGTRSALLAVTVGAPAQWRIGGRVLTAGGEPVRGARVSCVVAGTTNTNQRQCLTDSEGNYLLSGLPAADYNVTALHQSYTLAAGFTPPLTLVDTDLTADFTAAAKPTITMSLVDDACAENGDGALLRFTRTAASNAGALDVRVFAGGSASLGELTLAPAATYELTTYKFTLPDGAASLDVAISANNDSSAEGPETLTFYIIDGSGYIPAGVEHVTLAVNDDDTTLPVISLEAVDNSATEGGDGGALRLRRTGSTDAPQVISLTRTGTATTADYTGINTTATFPAGAAQVDLALTAVPDSAVEGTESVTVSISSSATWIRSPQMTSASITILDDDLPTVTITAADNAASEAAQDPAVFIVTRTGDLSAALSVDYALGGTAHHGTDYQPLAGTLIIPAGLATAALVIAPVDDDIGEQQQTITVQFRSTARYAVGAAFSATATLNDNDLPHLMVTVSDGSADEAGGTGKFRIQSYGTGTANTTVFYTITGTALSGADFTAVSGSITVPRSGASEVTITPLQDAELEDAESVIFTLVPDPAYTIAPEHDAALFILDDDQPMVSVAAASLTYAENAGAARFYFSRNGATTDALIVAYALSGTASAGADFTAPSGSIEIPAGASGAALDVALLDDADSEGAESLICSVVSAPGTHGARVASATLWLTDNETAGLAQANFAASTSAHAEDAGTVQISVVLQEAAASEVRVEYALESGLAFNGVDYTAVGGVLVFPPGETTQNISVAVLDDIFTEPAETLVLRLVRAAGGRVANVTAHTLTITDNDLPPAPVAGFAAATSAAGEGSGTPPLALVFLSAPQTTARSLQWAVTGGTASAADATALSGTLTFQPGETAKPVPLQVLDDELLEPAETFVITLSAPVAPLTLAPLVTHTVTVADNDDSVVSITSADPSAAEDGDAGSFIITRVAANLSQPLTVLVNVSGGATAGDDYAALPASVEIPALATTATLTVAPVDDAEFDPAETVTLMLAPSAFYSPGAQTAATVTISDNETGLAIAATDAGVAEPDQTGAFTITRSGPASGELTVALVTGGSAVAGEDFAPLPASIVFADGQVIAVITVTPMDDTIAEPAETIALTLQPGGGYTITTATAEVTLSDDDTNLAPVITMQSPAAPTVLLPRGPGLVLDATVTDDGRPFPAAPPVVSWSRLSGPGSVSFGNANAADTTAQFDLPGQYLLRLSAADAELSASADLSVFVLSDTFTGANIGHSSALTGLAGGGTNWTLTGLGSTVGTAAADSTYFAHRQMSGDFTLIARVMGVGSLTSTSARCGVMVRSALTPGARHAFASVAPTRTSFVYRANENAAGVTNNTTQVTPFPRWVRLRRVGNTFTAAHSPDGVQWTAQGSAQSIAMNDPVFVGLCATSGSTSATVTAAFENFSITPAGNVAPFVDAGPQQAAGLSATLAGVVTDEAPPAVQWEKLAGPGSVTLPATAAGSALFSTAGTYQLRLTADDGEVRTFADTSLVITSPFADWQTQHFGPAADPAISGPRADPDADGLENLAEYALTSDPLVPDANAAPLSSRTDTTLSMTWRESSTASDVLIAPQWSDDLAAWHSSDLAIETLSTGEGWTEKRATLDITARPRAALRLLVTLPQNEN